MKTSKTALCGAIIFALGTTIACGGANKSSSIMTPEERLEAQLAEAERQREIEEQSTDSYDASSTVKEEESKFDEDSATHEMKRAALNAVDCPNTFEKSQRGAYAPGTATVTLTFQNNGSVKDVSVSAPYADTPVGNCIVRAMGTVRVEMFSGAEVTKTWPLELQEAKDLQVK